MIPETKSLQTFASENVAFTWKVKWTCLNWLYWLSGYTGYSTAFLTDQPEPLKNGLPCLMGWYMFAE